MQRKRPRVSIVVTTYNRPLALSQVLRALENQTYSNFEVVVADDGSTDETRDMIEKLRQSLHYELKHVWQADIGFRLARSRNNAILAADGEYVVFLDGDCLPVPNFISKHVELAEEGWFVRGSRIMLSQALTQSIENSLFNILDASFRQIISLWLGGQVKRISPLFRFPLGVLRKLKFKQWRGAKTCNMGVWRSDLIKVNGFDEEFVGWGHEDADLVARLINAHVYRKEGLYSVPVFHLWHKEYDRSNETRNRDRVDQVIRTKTIRVKFGLDNRLQDS